MVTLILSIINILQANQWREREREKPQSCCITIVEWPFTSYRKLYCTQFHDDFFFVISFHFNSIHVIVQFKVFLWHVDRWLVYLFEWIICFDFGSISLFQCEYFMWIATKKYLFQHRICSKRCRDMDVPSENGDSSRLFFKWKSVFSHSISMLLQFKLNGESV